MMREGVLGAGMGGELAQGCRVSVLRDEEVPGVGSTTREYVPHQ